MENSNQKQYIIAIFVENTWGVLTRVTAMFTRRGFSIDTITSGATENPAFARVTICFHGDEVMKEQIIAQLKKLYVVKKVEAIEEEPIKRELMLIKVKNESQNRGDIMTAVDIFRASVIDYTPTGMCIEVTGNPSKIDAFVKLMEPFGILEMCRTGIVALDRGETTLYSK